jgi:hypothetical protein
VAEIDQARKDACAANGLTDAGLLAGSEFSDRPGPAGRPLSFRV